MTNTVRVLPRETVKPGATTRIPVGPAAAAGPTAGGAGRDAAVPQQARVIEANDEYAVIEVVCSCGQTMRLQCRYGPG